MSENATLVTITVSSVVCSARLIARSRTLCTSFNLHVDDVDICPFHLTMIDNLLYQLIITMIKQAGKAERNTRVQLIMVDTVKKALTASKNETRNRSMLFAHQWLSFSIDTQFASLLIRLSQSNEKCKDEARGLTPIENGGFSQASMHNYVNDQ